MWPSVSRTIGALAPFVSACAFTGSREATALAPPETEAGALADAGGAEPPAPDAATGPIDAAARDDRDAPTDAGEAETEAGITCAWGGAPGRCIDVAACAKLTDHTSYAGECPGPAAIACCITTPSTADNPPVPGGYHLMAQSQVTPDMTAWAVSILNDPATYPMFATTTKSFGALDVLARVEWHAPDFQNAVVHRGVTLYVP